MINFLVGHLAAPPLNATPAPRTVRYVRYAVVVNVRLTWELGSRHWDPNIGLLSCLNDLLGLIREKNWFNATRLATFTNNVKQLSSQTLLPKTPLKLTTTASLRTRKRWSYGRCRFHRLHSGRPKGDFRRILQVYSPPGLRSKTQT